MTSLFDDLKEGLNQAIDFEKGKNKAKVNRLVIKPYSKASVTNGAVLECVVISENGNSLDKMDLRNIWTENRTI